MHLVNSRGKQELDIIYSRCLVDLMDFHMDWASHLIS
jgi:hypothetical protein